MKDSKTKIKENRALPMMVEPGRNNSASRMPKRADASVAPVAVSYTHLDVYKRQG